jgi:hypothetical protein
MSVPSKAKAIKLDNPATIKVSHQLGTTYMQGHMVNTNTQNTNTKYKYRNTHAANTHSEYAGSEVNYY